MSGQGTTSAEQALGAFLNSIGDTGKKILAWSDAASREAATQPTLDVGIHYDVPESVYHADPCPAPSLSSSLARVLLAKSPAHAALEHPRIGGVKRESTAAMGLGTLIHAILAGGDSIVVGEFGDFRTNAAKEWRDTVKDSGKIPVLAEPYEAAKLAADSVRKRAAMGVDNSPFTSPHARSEVSLVWKEKDAYCRARLDVFDRDPSGSGYADIWDWKSTSDISDRGIAKSIANFRYDIQVAFYLRGLETLLPEYRGRTSFVLVFFETTPPYAVRRVTLAPSYLNAAQTKVNEAINLWAHCMKTGDFPITPPDTLQVELPAYLDDNDGEIKISE